VASSWRTRVCAVIVVVITLTAATHGSTAGRLALDAPAIASLAAAWYRSR
jgi:hypothetical protein